MQQIKVVAILMVAILLSSFLVIIPLPRVQAADVSAGWNYYGLLQIDHTYFSEPVVNFPVLVTINSSIGALCNSGESLRFYDPTNTTQYFHEIDTWWGGASTSYVWVRIPVIDSTVDTYFTMWYGNAAVADNQSANVVWSEYDGVYHMDDYRSGWTYCEDSAGGSSHNNADDGWQNSTTVLDFDATFTQGISGNYTNFSSSPQYKGFGFGDIFDAGTEDIEVIWWEKLSYPLYDSSKWPSVWQSPYSKYDATAGRGYRFVWEYTDPDDNFFQTASAAGNSGIFNNAFDTTYNESINWHFVVTQYDKATNDINLWINMTNVGTNLAHTSMNNTVNFTIGSNPARDDEWFNGSIDEFRITLNNNHNQSWLDAVYNTSDGSGISFIKTVAISAIHIFGITPTPGDGDYMYHYIFTNFNEQFDITAIINGTLDDDFINFSIWVEQSNGTRIWYNSSVPYDNFQANLTWNTTDAYGTSMANATYTRNGIVDWGINVNDTVGWQNFTYTFSLINYYPQVIRVSPLCGEGVNSATWNGTFNYTLIDHDGDLINFTFGIETDDDTWVYLTSYNLAPVGHEYAYSLDLSAWTNLTVGNYSLRFVIADPYITYGNATGCWIILSVVSLHIDIVTPTNLQTLYFVDFTNTTVITSGGGGTADIYSVVTWLNKDTGDTWNLWDEQTITTGVATDLDVYDDLMATLNMQDTYDIWWNATAYFRSGGVVVDRDYDVIDFTLKEYSLGTVADDFGITIGFANLRILIALIIIILFLAIPFWMGWRFDIDVPSILYPIFAAIGMIFAYGLGLLEMWIFYFIMIVAILAMVFKGFQYFSNGGD